MVHAAVGFAKQNHRKKIYACTSSVGPGAANMITAAATATANRIPVLLLPGDTYASRQPDPVLQQLEQFDSLMTTTNDAFKSVCKYWDRINRPEQLMPAMIQAMRVLTDPANTGAVAIGLPQDVEGEAYDYPEYFFAERIHVIERRPPMERRVQLAAKAFEGKKKPILICGGGVRYSEAGETLRAFAEKFNIPFGETQAGKSALPYDHELNLGGIGTTGGFAANKISAEADLVIGVGTRYTDFTTASKWLFKNENVTYVNINVAEFDAYKLDGVQLVADAREGLKALEKELEAVGYRSGYTNEIKEVKRQWEDEIKRLFSIRKKNKDRTFIPEVKGHLDEVLDEYERVLQSSLTQTRVLGILDEVLEDDAIVVGASGSLPGDLQRIWQPKAANTYHMEYGYSCMGYEINAAFGAKLARPGQEVYALVGDGSYIMLHSELITSIQERKKINVIVFDNMEFGCINNLQMSNGMGSFGTEMRYRNSKTGKLDGDLVYIDFAMNAKAYGVETYTAKTEEDLYEALKKVKESKVSTLIDVKVLPKTMTEGYESWWRVGNAEIAKKSEIVEKTKELKKNIAKARQY